MCQSRLSILKSIWNFSRSFHLQGSVKGMKKLQSAFKLVKDADTTFSSLVSSSSFIIYRETKNLHSICFLPPISLSDDSIQCTFMFIFTWSKRAIVRKNKTLFPLLFRLSLEIFVHFFFFFISNRHQPQYIWNGRESKVEFIAERKVHIKY